MCHGRGLQKSTYEVRFFSDKNHRADLDLILNEFKQIELIGLIKCLILNIPNDIHHFMGYLPLATEIDAHRVGFSMQFLKLFFSF